MLHHLPDAKKALAALSGFQGTLVLMEPNGLNPVLKMIEKFSAYHRAHEEQSFLPSTIRGWLAAAGFDDWHVRFLNLVPFFCPDWMAHLCQTLTPLMEKIPLARALCCGQQIIVARKKRT